MKIKKGDSYLDLIPVRIESMEWYEGDDGKIHIRIPRKTPVDRLVRLFKNTPDHMRVDLDEIGSSAWKSMDGINTIGDICDLMTDRFGDDVEPVYERVGTYINILRNNKFITLEKQQGGRKHDRQISGA